MENQKLINRWLVVVGSMLIGLLAGICYTWSLFVVPLRDTYNWDVDSIAMIGNVMMAVFSIGATVGGIMLPKVGAKPCSLLGTIIYTIGVVWTAFATTPTVMYIAWGILAGLGAGILYAMGMYVASAWFPDKRGIIMGVFLCLFGLSVTIFTQPTYSMLDNVGARSTLLFYAIFIGVVGLFVSLFLMQTPPEGWVPKGYIVPSDNSNTQNELESCTVSESLRTKTFWMYFGAYGCLAVPYFFISSYATVFLSEYKSLLYEQAVFIVGLMGIGAATGRIFGGFIVDRIGCRKSYATGCLLSVLSCLLLFVCNSYIGLMIGFFLVSFGFGSRMSTYGCHPVEQFGPKYASSMFGWAILATVPTTVLAPMITAWTRNSTGSYTPAIIIAIIASLIGMCGITFAPKQSPYMKKNQIQPNKKVEKRSEPCT